MRTYVIYGLLIALATAVLTYTEFFLGYHNDPAKFAAGSSIGTLGGPLLLILGLVLGIRTVRKKRPDRSLSYGRGVLAGTAIGFFAGLFGAISIFIYGTVVNPGFHQLLRERISAEIDAMGLPEQQAEIAEGLIGVFTSAPVIAFFQLIATTIFACVLSLVIAAFLKRAPAAEPPPLH
ncbi:MAG: DUF4199 domain-containing protein [Opitutaceae bacterium]